MNNKTTSEAKSEGFTHIVRDVETGAVLDYCTSAEQAAAFAAEENEVAFAGEARAVVEPLS
jgi:hypothetical protein